MAQRSKSKRLCYLAAPLLLGAGTSAYAATIIQHWGVIGRNTLGSPAANLVVGPYGRTSNTFAADQAPLCGKGSLAVEVAGPHTGEPVTDAEKLAFGSETIFANTPIASITALKYAVFVGMDVGTVTSLPGIAIEINSPSGPVISYSSLVYLPNSSTPPSAPAINPAYGSWQTYDATAMGSQWFATGAGGTATGCTLAAPCSWTALQAALPNAVVSYSLGFSKGRDDAFRGALDCLRVNKFVYDFEATRIIRRTAPK